VIHNRDEGIKKSLAHPYLVPNVAILDPILTVDLPPRMTAGTGIDALSHALETCVSSGARPIIEMWSVCALELIGQHLLRAVHSGEDLAAREGMLVASYLAGLALNAGVGTAHILAQPISAVHGLSHSDAISLVLRATVERNLDYASERYTRAAQALGEDGRDILKVIDRVYCETQVGSKLADYGVTHVRVDEILDRVRRSTGHLTTNPRPVDETLLADILNSLI
jgi:alcohol dehydrogenase class IV